MNEQQQRDAALLKKLITETPCSRQARGFTLLGTSSPMEEGQPFPENFCKGWAFKSGRHYANALDILYQIRKHNKKSYAFWTQGTKFYFKEGYTTERHDMTMAVQVKKAHEAIPQTETSARDPGVVQAAVYIPADPPQIWKYSHSLDITQDDFVHLLITGEAPLLTPEGEINGLS